MLSVSVIGENSKKGRQELDEFDKLLNSRFTVTEKSLIKFTKIFYDKENYLNINRTTINRDFNENNILKILNSNVFSASTQEVTQAQPQTNLIHQANVFQGVNLIYSVNTN